jgi:hypothetical protein
VVNLPLVSTTTATNFATGTAGVVDIAYRWQICFMVPAGMDSELID